MAASANPLRVTATPLLKHLSFRATFRSTAVEYPQFETSSDPRLFIVLDVSGSMANGSLSAAQTALSSSLPSLRRSFAQIHLIPFNSKAAIKDLTSYSDSSVRRVLQKLRAHGRTSFASFFKVLVDALDTVEHQGNNRNVPVSIVVLSDGADNHGLRDPVARADACVGLQSLLKNLAPISQIHAIGLGDKHDPAMMALLASVGTVRGSFTFAPGAAQVESAIADQLTMAQQHTLPARVTLFEASGAVAHEFQANFTRVTTTENDGQLGHSDEHEEYELCSYFAHNPDSIITSVTFSFCDKTLSTPVEMRQDFEITTAGEQSQTPVELRLFCGTARALVLGLVTDLVTKFPLHESDKEYLSSKHTEFGHLTTKLHTVVLPQCARNKAAKTDILHALSVLRKVQTDLLLPSLRAAKVSSVRYAELVDLAYADVRNSRLRGLLQKRSIGNRTHLENLEEDISKALHNVDIRAPSFRDGLEQYGHCLYKSVDVVDLLADGDSLCLGLDVRRPEAAIADPTRMEIISVGPSVLSADALLEALQFRLHSDMGYGDIAGNDVEGFAAYAGYDSSSEKILSGAARENISGGLPLFVNENHWKVSKLRARPLLGWMFTLDVLGFTPDQMRVLPFLVLDKLRFGTDDSEFMQRVQGWVLDVCRAVLRDQPAMLENLFGESIVYRLRYLDDPTARLPDVVPSHKVFTMQLNVVYQMEGHELSSDDRKFLAFLMLIEQLRRVWRTRRQTAGAMNGGYQDGENDPFDDLTRAEIVGVDEAKIESIVDEELREYVNDDGTPRLLDKWCFENGTAIPRHAQNLYNRYEEPEPSYWDVQMQANNGEGVANASWIKPDNLTRAVKRALREVASMTRQICKRLALIWEPKHTQRLCVLYLALVYPSGAVIRTETETFQHDCRCAFDESLRYLVAQQRKISEEIARRAQRKVEIRDGAAKDVAIASMFLESADVNEAAGIVRGWLYVGRNVSLVLKVLLGLVPHHRRRDAGDSGMGSKGGLKTKKAMLKIRLLCSGQLGDVDELHADRDSVARRERFDGLAWKPRRKWVRMLFKALVLDVAAKDGNWDGIVEKAEVARWVREFPWMERELKIWATEMSKGRLREYIEGKGVAKVGQS